MKIFLILLLCGSAEAADLRPYAANATTAVTATNLAGGLVGYIPYQSAINTTAMLTAGTANYVLQANGAAAPTWTNALNHVASLTASSATITGNAFSVGGSTIVVKEGKVGIGIATPLTHLHVNGRIISSNCGANPASGTSLEMCSMGSTAFIAHRTMPSTYHDTEYHSQSHKFLAGAAGDVDALNIIASGNVGIGTASPAAKLHVAGDIVIDSVGLIKSSTTDGADNSYWYLAGGGTQGSSRGAAVGLGGNESLLPGTLYLDSGDVSGAKVVIRTAGLAKLTVNLNGTFTPKTFTQAELLVLAPLAVNDYTYCSDCPTATVVVGTGTSAGNWADGADKTAKCFD